MGSILVKSCTGKSNEKLKKRSSHPRKVKMCDKSQQVDLISQTTLSDVRDHRPPPQEIPVDSSTSFLRRRSCEFDRPYDDGFFTFISASRDDRSKIFRL